MKRAVILFLMVALLSPPLLASADPQTIVPNGIARIGAANTEETPLDFSGVGVAVIDTGIDLSSPELNVVGGVDCSVGATGYQSSSVVVDGGQRSVWDPRPKIKNAEGKDVPDPNAISFGHLRFSIASQQNPANIGGSRAWATGYDDANGHGTHVAGIIGAKDDGQGVVGVAPNASLYSVRVLDGQGGGSFDSLICGLDWVAANADKIDVANMSLGANTQNKVMDVVEPCDTDEDDYPPYIERTSLMRDELHEAVCDVVEAGVVLVVAAGNGWGDAATVVPAAYPEVVTVSSFADFDGLTGGLAVDTDPDPDINTVSSCPEMGGGDDQFFTHLNGTPGLGIGSFGGEVVDIAAPGVCVLSTFPNAGMASLTGTSMATPHVTGAVARLAADPELAKTMEQLVSTTGKPVRKVEGLTLQLLIHADEQDENFRDSDEWHEPLVHVE